MIVNTNACYITYLITGGTKEGESGSKLGKVPRIPYLVAFLHPGLIFIEYHELSIRDTEVNKKTRILTFRHTF